MLKYIDYLDETGGVKPGKNEKSFNNVVYSTYLLLAKKYNKTLDETDTTVFLNHLENNTDENGLYKPKSSHDNITCSMVSSELFFYGHFRQYSLAKLAPKVGIYRIWDIILYGYILNTNLNSVFKTLLMNPYQRFLYRIREWFFSSLIIIPCIQMITSCMKKHKVRPHVNERILWTLQRKPYEKRYFLNDGKPLAIVKLSLLKNRNFMFKMTAKICNYFLKKRYGKKYMYAMMCEYFKDTEHPVRKEWEKVDFEVLNERD